jgi:AAA domain
MIIGLTGAHRTGKTTLGSEFAKRNKQFKFAATSVTAIMQSRGFDPALDYPMVERIEIQNIILGELDAFYSRFDNNTVFDRTPLDAAAYLLADVQRQNVEREFHGPITEYVSRAIEITNRRFAMLLFVPPVLKMEDTPGKAPSAPAYVEHISQLIAGLRSDERMKVKYFSLPRSYLDLDLRVRAMENATGRLVRNFMAEGEQLSDAGIDFH